MRCFGLVALAGVRVTRSHRHVFNVALAQVHCLGVTGDSMSRPISSLLSMLCSTAEFAGVTRAVICATLLVLLLYPWNGEYYPEGNWLRGPMWLFAVQSVGDKIIGAMITAFLLPTLTLWAFSLNVYTAFVGIVGALVWLGFGMWLAAAAVA